MPVTSSPLPIRALKRVHHVGTLDARDKSAGGSYEGAGLSISLDPQRWIEIACLGGLPVWSLHRAEPETAGVFVEAHDLSAEQRSEITVWGVERGLLTLRESWRVTWYDSEMDGDTYTDFSTRLEAEQEAADLDEARIEPVTTRAATERLEALLGMRSPGDCLDHLLTVYVDEIEPDIDGVWWQDHPGPWSAPRGVILASRLHAWTSAPAA